MGKEQPQVSICHFLCCERALLGSGDPKTIGILGLGRPRGEPIGWGVRTKKSLTSVQCLHMCHGPTNNGAVSAPPSDPPDVYQATASPSHSAPCTSTAIAESTILPKLATNVRCMAYIIYQTLVPCHFLLSSVWLSQ